MLTYFYIVLVLLGLVNCKNEDYKGYKVYNIKLTNQEQQENILTLKSDVIDFWRKPNLKHDVIGKAMVPPSHFDWFEEQLKQLNITIDVFVEDVYEYLLQKEPAQPRSQEYKCCCCTTTTISQFDTRKYNRYDDILYYLKTLAGQYSSTSTRVELIDHGITEQNREVVYLKISRGDDTNKPVIVIEGGINPREWITIPSALNVIERIIEEELYLDAFDWIIAPVVNPDGYEYTHTNLRLWMKSRSIRSNLGFICPGVNINRNFDVDWLNFDSSSSPCSHLYGGVAPFSEVETQLIRDVVQEYGNRIKLYISLQNNGGFISYPWSYERAASGMFRQNHLLGLDMVRTLNDSYKMDVAAVAFDRASGTSSDYARINDVLYSYNFDIADRGDGVIIPEEDINSIVDDVWEAIAIAATEMMRLYV